MKLFIPLTSLILVVSSVDGTLRGENRRNLANYLYKEYPGVCRKNANGTGGGTDGTDYDVFKLTNNPDVTYRWCKDKCNNQNSCTGFEYRDSGSTSQCEVWKKPILGYEKKNNHDCMVKGDRVHSYNCQYGACRKYEDGTGKGNSGDEYALIKGGTYIKCKTMCSEKTDCKGFEYRWGYDETAPAQCEIWKSAINSVEQEDKWDLECCTKEYK